MISGFSFSQAQKAPSACAEDSAKLKLAAEEEKLKQQLAAQHQQLEQAQLMGKNATKVPAQARRRCPRLPRTS